MSGQDVFRIDSAGRVMRHESAWDQSPEAAVSYLNPLAHIPILEEFLPIFSNAVPKRPVPEAEDEAPAAEPAYNSGTAAYNSGTSTPQGAMWSRE